MTKRSKDYEPPLHLDLDFSEALERFAQTDKGEAEELRKQGKKKKPPRPEKVSKSATVIHHQKATPSGRR